MGNARVSSALPCCSAARYMGQPGGMAAVLVCIALHGCGNDHDSGDTAGTLPAVQQLVAQRCAGSSCHIDFADQPAGALDLSPEVMCANLIEVPAAESPSQPRVRPGDAAASYLLCKLVPDCDQRAAGASLMPPGFATGLPAAEIELVASWIDGGAPGCAGPDRDAPQFAGAAAATPLPSAIRLEWEPATDDVSAPGEIVYLIYQATQAGGQDFTQPTLVTEPGATSATLGGLPLSTRFFHVVRARDLAGNQDDNTVEVSATTPETGDETPPVFAGVKSAAPVGASAVSLSWLPASDDVSPASDIRYAVYVGDAPASQDFSTPRLTTAPGALEALVTGLAAETTYYFTVRAVDASGNQDDNTVEIAASTGGQVSFSAQVQPILTDRCTGRGCHDGAMAAQDLDLEAGRAHGQLVGVPSMQCSDRLRVAPGAPAASYLVNKIKNIDICSGTRMPKSGSLGADEIQLIVDWIAQGALDN